MPPAAAPAAPAEPPLRWVKADLHLHTAEDPCDVVEPPATEMLDRAAAEGFQVLAITLHGAVLERADLAARARDHGILLLPGAELRLDGADVVVLNLSAAEAAATRTFADLRRLRARRGASLFVLAPHPFYVLGGSLGTARMQANRDCFDAVELCHLPIPLPSPWNPNAAAARFAHRHGLPLVATSDAHRRWGFGKHFSLVGLPGGAAPDVDGFFAALRAGHVRPVRPAHGKFWHFLSVLWFIFVLHPRQKHQRRRRRARARAAGDAAAKAISLCPSRSAS